MNQRGEKFAPAAKILRDSSTNEHEFGIPFTEGNKSLGFHSEEWNFPFLRLLLLKILMLYPALAY